MIHVFEHVCVYVTDFIKIQPSVFGGFALNKFGRTLGTSGAFGRDVSDVRIKRPALPGKIIKERL